MHAVIRGLRYKEEEIKEKMKEESKDTTRLYCMSPMTFTIHWSVLSLIFPIVVCSA